MIVLASKSPRRKKILSDLGYSFIVCPAEHDEIFDPHLCLDDALKKVAYSKACEVQEKYLNDMIVSADTIVSIDGNILGKPKDRDDATKTLSILSGRNHQVKTGICVLYRDSICLHVETTQVYFRKLKMSEIEAYVDSGKCLDKAGSYGIQECDFVDHIEGDYLNVVGLSGVIVDQMIKELQKEYINDKIGK